MKTLNELNDKIMEISQKKELLYKEYVKEKKKNWFLRSIDREETILSKIETANNVLIGLMYASGAVNDLIIE